MEITWNTKDLPLRVIHEHFGAGSRSRGAAWVQKILALGKRGALAHCKCRAVGAWDACLREDHAVYNSLARLIETGELVCADELTMA